MWYPVYRVWHAVSVAPVCAPSGETCENEVIAIQIKIVGFIQIFHIGDEDQCHFVLRCLHCDCFNRVLRFVNCDTRGI
jgi:hypothetical protein